MLPLLLTVVCCCSCSPFEACYLLGRGLCTTYYKKYSAVVFHVIFPYVFPVLFYFYSVGFSYQESHCTVCFNFLKTVYFANTGCFFLSIVLSCRPLLEFVLLVFQIL